MRKPSSDRTATARFFFPVGTQNSKLISVAVSGYALMINKLYYVWLYTPPKLVIFFEIFLSSNFTYYTHLDTPETDQRHTIETYRDSGA